MIVCPDIAARYGGHPEIIIIMLPNNERMKRARQELDRFRGDLEAGEETYIGRGTRIVGLLVGDEALWHILRDLRDCATIRSMM